MTNPEGDYTIKFDMSSDGYLYLDNDHGDTTNCYCGVTPVSFSTGFGGSVKRTTGPVCDSGKDVIFFLELQKCVVNGVGETKTFNEDTTLNLNAANGLLSNDDAGSTIVEYTNYPSGKAGSVLNADGSLTYIPFDNAFGTLTFSYKVIYFFVN